MDKLNYILELKAKYQKEYSIYRNMKVYDIDFDKQCLKVNRILAKYKKLKRIYFGGNNTLEGIKI